MIYGVSFKVVEQEIVSYAVRFRQRGWLLFLKMTYTESVMCFINTKTKIQVEKISSAPQHRN